jgi:hypothetical protein
MDFIAQIERRLLPLMSRSQILSATALLNFEGRPVVLLFMADHLFGPQNSFVDPFATAAIARVSGSG